MVVAPERGLTLYELADEYAAIKRLLDAEARADEIDHTQEHVPQNALEVALDALGTAIERKAEGILFVYKQQAFEAGLMADEANRLRRMADEADARADAKRNGAERLKNYLAEQLGSLGDDTQRFETPRVRATLAKRGKDVVVVDDDTQVAAAFKIATLKMPAADVPVGFAPFVTDISIAKSAINDVYARTGVIPKGCATAPGKRSLRIS